MKLTPRFRFATKAFDIQNKSPNIWLLQKLHFVAVRFPTVGNKRFCGEGSLLLLVEFKDIEMKLIKENSWTWE
jgi:hypothetical protein